jgi:hypothetical protein
VPLGRSVGFIAGIIHWIASGLSKLSGHALRQQGVRRTSGSRGGRNAPNKSRSSGVQHPDLVAGRSFDSITTGDPNGWFDPTAFVLPPAPPAGLSGGFYGNAGRNILIGPGLLNFDFSLQKSTPLPLGEGRQLQFNANFFNLFNRSNFSNPRFNLSRVLNPATGAYIKGAGRITTTATSSRQLQFGLKFIF